VEPFYLLGVLVGRGGLDVLVGLLCGFVGCGGGLVGRGGFVTCGGGLVGGIGVRVGASVPNWGTRVRGVAVSMK
jgi:hypothetical protein